MINSTLFCVICILSLIPCKGKTEGKAVSSYTALYWSHRITDGTSAIKGNDWRDCISYTHTHRWKIQPMSLTFSSDVVDMWNFSLLILTFPCFQSWNIMWCFLSDPFLCSLHGKHMTKWSSHKKKSCKSHKGINHANDCFCRMLVIVSMQYFFFQKII